LLLGGGVDRDRGSARAGVRRAAGAVAGIELAAPRVRERAQDVVLRGAVVAQVEAERGDGLPVAALLVDGAVDAVVVVPVVDHPLGTRLRVRRRGQHERDQEQQRETTEEHAAHGAGFRRPARISYSAGGGPTGGSSPGPSARLRRLR
jgi:hypothetical protein